MATDLKFITRGNPKAEARIAKADRAFENGRPHGPQVDRKLAAEPVDGQGGDALLDTSHDGLALAMGEEWADARHVAPWGQWLFWSGACWTRDEHLLHMTRTRGFLRGKGDDLVRWARRQNDERGVKSCEAIVKQLRSAQTVANVVGL